MDNRHHSAMAARNNSNVPPPPEGKISDYVPEGNFDKNSTVPEGFSLKTRSETSAVAWNTATPEGKLEFPKES